MLSTGIDSLSQEQWDRARSLFHEAVDIPPLERKAFCAAISDARLRSSVEELLLAADQLSPDYLTRLYPASHAINDEEPRESQDRGEFSGFPLVGLILKDRYEILKPLSRGGQGWVFLAKDRTAADLRLVIKFLQGTDGHIEWLRKRLDTERKALNKLKHPSVVGLQDHGEIGGVPYLVMEYVDGLTLREALKSEISASRKAEIIICIGQALKAAHDLGIHHRDVKPENVMITDSAVKLIDFGIAQNARTETGTTTTILMVSGTPEYMAPEQFLGICNAQTDIYSFAVLIFEMLTGACPYQGDDALRVARVQRMASIRSILEKEKRLLRHVWRYLWLPPSRLILKGVQQTRMV